MSCGLGSVVVGRGWLFRKVGSLAGSSEKGMSVGNISVIFSDRNSCEAVVFAIARAGDLQAGVPSRSVS